VVSARWALKPGPRRLISQSKAAAIAGLNRGEFLMARYHAKVGASQVDIEEMKEDV
jgi:hypothetical protein